MQGRLQKVTSAVYAECRECHVRTPPQRIRFVSSHEIHSGTGRADRRWVIRPHPTGWHLEFRDPGDVDATYAGTYGTLKAAQLEACR